jgi:hypothetical protein
MMSYGFVNELFIEFDISNEFIVKFRILDFNLVLDLLTEVGVMLEVILIGLYHSFECFF